MNQLQLLLVEDSVTVQQMVRKMLLRANLVDFDIQACANLTDGLVRLNEGGIDVVLLDLTLPESTGVNTVSLVRDADKEVPIVVLTGCDDDSLAVAAMHKGADDFLVKKEVRQGSLLSRTLLYAVEKKRARIALDRYVTEMEVLAEGRARQLRHQDRLASIGTMSAGVAHEIKNPLSYISSNTHALADAWPELEKSLQASRDNGFGDEEEIKFLLAEFPSMLEDIQSGVDRILEISDSLKSFARKSSREPEPTSVEDLIDKALLLCRNLLKYGIEVEKNYGTENVAISLQPQKMLQVFVNLFNNAVDAMEETGSLKLTTSLQEKTVQIRVADSGPGIPHEALESIWDPFFTTKPEDVGTGLGLPICKEILEEHGGCLTVENDPQGGACFTLEIPLEPVEGQTGGSELCVTGQEI